MAQSRNCMNERVLGEEAVCVAFLHDVTEDAEITPDDLSAEGRARANGDAASTDEGYELRFSRGGFFGGERVYSITRDGDICQVIVEGFNGDNTRERGTAPTDIVKSEIVDFVLGLGWDERYEPEVPASDGYSWSLRVEWGEEAFASSGYMCYPEDYAEKSTALEFLITALIDKMPLDLLFNPPPGARGGEVSGVVSLMGGTDEESPDATCCPYCGAVVDPGFRFCVMCGASLDG